LLTRRTILAGVTFGSLITLGALLTVPAVRARFPKGPSGARRARDHLPIAVAWSGGLSLWESVAESRAVRRRPGHRRGFVGGGAESHNAVWTTRPRLAVHPVGAVLAIEASFSNIAYESAFSADAADTHLTLIYRPNSQQAHTMSRILT
jgi:hypothetical protein